MNEAIIDTTRPQILYKYREWSNVFHKKLISSRQIYFPKTSEFNDPFDGNIPVRWDKLTFDDCVEKNMQIINAVHSDKDQKKVREYAIKVTNEKTLWHPDKISKENDEQLEKWNSIIGLLSLSSERDNILMWSHYAENHKGFVVGLNTESLISNYDFDYLEPITYQGENPLISGLDDTTFQFYKKFFTKSNLWSYEKEWRISKNHINNRIVQLNHDSFNHIIIGCCAENAQIKTMTKSIKKYFGNDFPIYRAIKDKSNFKLDIEQF